MAASLFPPAAVKAAAAGDIRVGLTGLYGKKDIITVYNTRTAWGYCKGNSFTAFETFYSPGGYSFEPEKGDFLIGSTVYPTFKNASVICESLARDGITAYPVMTGSGHWRIYADASVASFAEYGPEYRESTLERTIKDTLVHVTASGFDFLVDGYEQGYPQFKAISETGEQLSINLGSRRYRGRLEIVREASSVTAVNVVGLEAYLLGVISCEMGPSRPSEALKAQAVCSRSYAVAKAGLDADSVSQGPFYKINDTTDSQVYRGVGAETENSRIAVRSTFGEVIKTDSGAVLEAFYFSTDGGSTDTISDVWGYSGSNYAAVFDIYETDPEFGPWVEEYGFADLSSRLRSAGHDVGTVTGMKVTIYTEGQRAYQVLVSGTAGKVTLSGNQLRDILDLPSTKFRIVTSDPDMNRVFVTGQDGSVTEGELSGMYAVSAGSDAELLESFSEQFILISDGSLFNVPEAVPAAGSLSIIGMGKGHGVGMSQSGAAGMADAGFGYKEIIGFYYKNVSVGRY